MGNEIVEELWHWRAGIPIIRAGNRETYIGDHRIPVALSTAEIAWLTATKVRPATHSATDSSRESSKEPMPPARIQVMLEHLRATGALASQAECWWLAPPDRADAQRHLLALSEWNPDPEAAIAARSTWRIAVQGRGLVAEAISQLLSSSRLTVTAEFEADLVVITGPHGIDAPEALLPEGDSSVSDRPHLPVSAFRGHASIGPLVIPGRTPCLNCIHLHSCDTNPNWPHLVDQWRAAETLMAQEADPLLAWHAGTSAVAMLRHWIDSAHTPLAHRVRWRFPASVPTSEFLSPHPACGCRWGDSDR